MAYKGGAVMGTPGAPGYTPEKLMPEPFEAKKRWSYHTRFSSPKIWSVTMCAVAIVTLSAGQSLFVKKLNIPVSNLWSETKGPTCNKGGSHVVFTPVSRLGGLDGSCFKKKPEFQFLSTQHQQQNCWIIVSVCLLTMKISQSLANHEHARISAVIVKRLN